MIPALQISAILQPPRGGAEKPSTPARRWARGKSLKKRRNKQALCSCPRNRDGGGGEIVRAEGESALASLPLCMDGQNAPFRFRAHMDLYLPSPSLILSSESAPIPPLTSWLLCCFSAFAVPSPIESGFLVVSCLLSPSPLGSAIWPSNFTGQIPPAFLGDFPPRPAHLLEPHHTSFDVGGAAPSRVSFETRFGYR